MKIRETLSYDDVLLLPQYSDIRSRSEVKIGGALGEIICKLPIIASPMDTISESEMAVAVAQEGALAVIHRYNTIEEQCSLVEEAIQYMQRQR